MIYIYSLSTKEEPGNIRYIGKTEETIHRRLKRHLSKSYLKDSSYKVNWIKSQLAKGNSLIIEIIDVVKNDEWQFWEQYWILQFKAWGFRLTNGTPGGEGVKLSPSIINKRVNTLKQKREKEFNARIKKYKIKEVDDIWYGERKCCECGSKIIHKSKTRNILFGLMKKSEKRVCQRCKVLGDKSYFYGKKLNDGKLKQKKYGKKIIQIDLSGKKIAEFKSIREASEKTGIDRKSISNCSRGIKSYNTAGGYKFKTK